MNKRFVTIFPDAENIHIKKRIGMIPYMLHRNHGYDATLVCFKNAESYPLLEEQTKGLGLQFLPAGKNKFWQVVKYVKRHAAEIDVLNLYHQSRTTFIMGCLYKLINPNGILYVTLDMNIGYLENLFSKKPGRHLLFWNFFFNKIATIVSYESTEVKSFLVRQYKNIGNKLLLLTNGIDDVAIREHNIPNVHFDEKENLIITVGRIGAPEKNHELLLAAIGQLDLKDWSVAFIGPVDVAFNEHVLSCFQKKPELKNRVIFTGAIYNQSGLYSWYNRAKVFCLTSKREGFATVLPEAMYFGNYVVSTNVSAIADITDQGTLGAVVENEQELIATLQEIINDDRNIKLLCAAIKTKAQIAYSWTNIVAPLAQRLEHARA